MIAVVGGTGRLGRLVATVLLEAGEQVRVVARRPEAAAELAVLGAQTTSADVRDRSALGLAVEGADVVVSAVQGFAGTGGVSPASVDRDGNRHLVDAAVAAGADVVLVSVVGAAPDHPMELHRMKWAAEQHLRSSPAPWTIVRATAFAELWLEVVTGGRPQEARGTSSARRAQVLGRGENPVNFVSVGDVAAAVVRAATDPSLRGRVIDVGGPRDLTLRELAALRLPGRPRRVPRTALRLSGSLARPVSPRFARMARAALTLDTADMTFDAAPGHAAYPWLPSTPVE